MSDIEEPPTKVSKYEMSKDFDQSDEMSQTYTQPEEMEEGQEEWLSEELLTDDDEHLANQTNGSTHHTQSTTDSQDNTSSQESKAQHSNIEQTLNNLENRSQSELPEDLDAFLIRKTDIKVPDKQAEEKSDGNDTDDLLRMLEDDDRGKKTKLKKTTVVKETKRAPSSEEDDDEYIFEGATVKKLQVAKNVLLRKFPPTKAVPEETSDEETDASLDEATTVKKMFTVKRVGNFAAKSTSKPARAPVKQVVRLSNRLATSNIAKKQPVTSTPMKQFTNISKSKPAVKPAATNKPPPKVQPTKTQGRPIFKTVSKDRVVKTEVLKPTKPAREHEEIINEEEFLEDDAFDLDEDFATESDSELEKRAVKQTIMRPEVMDEDLLSDAASQSDDPSLYDELPSSESEDLDEWFTLDIRAERAGEYLPLLGPKAHDLLLEEKRRVEERLELLRQSLSSLADSGKLQTEKLRAASAALADIDDVLKAS